MLVNIRYMLTSGVVFLSFFPPLNSINNFNGSGVSLFASLKPNLHNSIRIISGNLITLCFFNSWSIGELLSLLIICTPCFCKV